MKTLLPSVPMRLSATFERFFHSEKSSGFILIACTVLSIWLSNSSFGDSYLSFWGQAFAGLSIEHWINDALMAIFFLLIGLELERELYSGELSNIQNALLPLLAAIGGVCMPALIHLYFNGLTPTQAGIGIPMATDIAFALGVLALLGSRIPASLKVFLAALAVVDDLIAVMIIAIFYTAQVHIVYLIGALAVWLVLILLNRYMRIMALMPYLIGGALMWGLMLKSGVHATASGVLLAFAIPYSAKAEDMKSPSHRLEHLLHKPVAFLILPVFALANTGIVIENDVLHSLMSLNSIGIILGLLVGKPIGIMLFSFLAITMGLSVLPNGLQWRHILGAGLLAGIGFTMSIFITNLAFLGENHIINSSKIAIFLASLVAGIIGFCWLWWVSRSTHVDI